MTSNATVPNPANGIAERSDEAIYDEYSGSPTNLHAHWFPRLDTAGYRMSRTVISTNPDTSTNFDFGGEASNAALLLLVSTQSIYTVLSSTFLLESPIDPENSGESPLGNRPDPASPLRIATRESKLAMWQANHIAWCLDQLGVSTQIVPLVSGGDTDMRPIDGSRSVGVFTKRIQRALVDNEADIAVHSLKDLPTEIQHEFVLAAVPPRATVLDCLVSPDGSTLDELPAGAKIGTGSTRRHAQICQLRTDVEVIPIRGNVQTRLSKMDSGEFDAIVLAEAGLERLELNDLPRQAFSLESMLPAPGQGALGIEVRHSDTRAFEIASKLDDRQARLSVTAERTLLAKLHGGCLAPIAAYAELTTGSEGHDQLSLIARVLSATGDESIEQQVSTEISAEDSGLEAAMQLGNRLADELKNRGADRLIQTTRGNSA